MRRFIDDDEGYLNWSENHPRGFVVNSNREPDPDYLVLHRANCIHITTEARTNWTTTDFVKICSLNRGRLANWARTISGRLRGCQICRPRMKRGLGERKNFAFALSVEYNKSDKRI